MWWLMPGRIGWQESTNPSPNSKPAVLHSPMSHAGSSAWVVQILLSTSGLSIPPVMKWRYTLAATVSDATWMKSSSNPPLPYPASSLQLHSQGDKWRSKEVWGKWAAEIRDSVRRVTGYVFAFCFRLRLLICSLLISSFTPFVDLIWELV